MPTKRIINELLSTLHKINNGEKVFFNIAQYTSLGLIRTRRNWGKDSRGNKIIIDHSYFLTDKSKRFIRVPVYAINKEIKK